MAARADCSIHHSEDRQDDADGDQARAFAVHAVEALRQASGIDVKSVSSLYETEPIGGPPQRSYINLVAAIETDLHAREVRIDGRAVNPVPFMQSMGIVNDHSLDCVIRDRVEAERVAEVRGLPVEELIAVTGQNAHRVFQLR